MAMARAEDSSQFGENARADRTMVGVTVDTQYPVDVGRNLRGHFFQGRGQLIGAAAAAEIQLVRCTGKQQFRRHHEAVADNWMSARLPVSAQLAEELGAVTQSAH